MDLRRYIVAKETGDMFVTKYPAVESDVVNDRNGCLCGSEITLSQSSRVQGSLNESIFTIPAARRRLQGSLGNQTWAD